MQVAEEKPCLCGGMSGGGRGGAYAADGRKRRRRVKVFYNRVMVEEVKEMELEAKELVGADQEEEVEEVRDMGHWDTEVWEERRRVEVRLGAGPGGGETRRSKVGGVITALLYQHFHVV